MTREIDREYFRAYAGGGDAYDEVYADYSRIDNCLALFPAAKARGIESVCVLGSATGHVLRDLGGHFGCGVDACEISSWAYARTPPRLKRHVCNLDMREYVEALITAGARYDLVFTNSLVYLHAWEVPPFLQRLRLVARRVHFQSSFLGDCCHDPYRKTLRSHKWWDRQFRNAGFSLRPGARGDARYLWLARPLND